MTDHEIQELLRRCEREAPSRADLGALEALLTRQEAGEGWAEVRDSLRSGLGAERDEVAREAATAMVAAVAPGAEGLVPEAMHALAAGLALEADRGEVAEAVLAAAGLEPWLPVEVLAAFADGLRAEAMGLELAEAVLADLQGAIDPDLALSALADGELTGAAREAAAACLAADPAARRFVNAAAEFGQVLRQGLAREVAAEDLASIWEGVAASIGLAEGALLAEVSLAELLASGIEAEAGTIDIAELVMARVAPASEESPAVVEAPLGPVARPRPVWQSWFGRLPALALVGAAAALLVVLQVIGPDGREAVPSDQPALLAPALELAAVNDTEIEDLEVAENAMVQVFQLDDGAPVVIFIDEGPAGESPEGVTL